MKLELQRPPADDANDQLKLQNDKVYRDLKVVKEIKTQIDKIMENIGVLHDKARSHLSCGR